MRFMLRCIFWLAFVYASILSNAGFHIGAIGRDDLAETARAAIKAPANAATSFATTSLATTCRRDPTACLTDAARLTTLISGGAEQRGVEQEDAAPAARRSDPRHRARGAMQARMP